MAGKPNEVRLSFLTLRVSARGAVAFIISVAVATLIVAIAWRIVQ